MAAKRFGRAIRIGLALTVAVLFSVMAVAALAADDKRTDRDRSAESKRQAEVQKRQEVERRDTQAREERSRSDNRSSSRRDEGRSERDSRPEIQRTVNSNASRSQSPGHVTSPWGVSRTTDPSPGRGNEKTRTQSPGHVTSPWGVTRVDSRAQERSQYDESKKRAEIERRSEPEKREAPRYQGSTPQPTRSPGHVTSPWAIPRSSTPSTRPDDDRRRSGDEWKKRAEVEKRREIESRDRPGYVTGPWAVPHTYTRLEDRYRDHKPPRHYNPPVFRSGHYYYPWLTSHRPCNYGFWVWDDCGISFCRRSVYFHYGIFPYVRVARLYIRPYIVLEYRKVTVYSGSGYYLDRHGYADLDDALADIRSAWTWGRADLIDKHVRDDVKIAVLLDGKYDYSVDSRDYLEMTRDAMGETDTVTFFWQSVRQRTDDAYTAFGQHVYTDSMGIRRTVYVSYTLEEIAGRYIITEVGSSKYSLLPT